MRIESGSVFGYHCRGTRAARDVAEVQWPLSIAHTRRTRSLRRHQADARNKDPKELQFVAIWARLVSTALVAAGDHIKGPEMGIIAERMCMLSGVRLYPRGCATSCGRSGELLFNFRRRPRAPEHFGRSSTWRTLATPQLVFAFGACLRSRVARDQLLNITI
jgi:hypothetical protein